MEATPFNPTYGANVRVTSAATPKTASILQGTRSLRVVVEPNIASAPGVFIKTYVSGSVNSPVSDKDTLVLPSTSLIIKKPIEDDTVEYITATGQPINSTINFQPGEGGVF